MNTSEIVKLISNEKIQINSHVEIQLSKTSSKTVFWLKKKSLSLNNIQSHRSPPLNINADKKKTTTHTHTRNPLNDVTCFISACVGTWIVILSLGPWDELCDWAIITSSITIITLSLLIHWCQRRGARLILSSHSLSATPMKDTKPLPTDSNEHPRACALPSLRTVKLSLGWVLPFFLISPDSTTGVSGEQR